MKKSVINYVELVGNVGNEPLVHQNTDGTLWLTVSLATNERYTVNNKNHVRTEWHQLMFGNRLAHDMTGTVKKGDFMRVKGRLRYMKRKNEASGFEYSAPVIKVFEYIKLPKKATYPSRQTNTTNDSQHQTHAGAL